MIGLGYSYEVSAPRDHGSSAVIPYAVLVAVTAVATVDGAFVTQAIKKQKEVQARGGDERDDRKRKYNSLASSEVRRYPRPGRTGVPA